MAAVTAFLPAAVMTPLVSATGKRQLRFSPLPSRRSSPFLSPSPSHHSLLCIKTPIAPFVSNSPLLLVSCSLSEAKECTLESQAREPEHSITIIRRHFIGALVLNALAFLGSVTCGACLAAADDSIRASGLGLKAASALRKFGWPDEAVVFTLATMPVLELRGAIPVGYWMQLDPLKLTFLSIIGNMVPVPFIVLYLKKFASFVSQRSATATRFVELLFERAREKAGPVEEFQWLGLMLFVAVPFPGTGAWTGAIIASILDMPFWSAFSANFVGVVLAGLLVNLLMNLGMKYAILTGLFLFFVSTVMWGVLRSLKKSLNSK